MTLEVHMYGVPLLAGVLMGVSSEEGSGSPPWFWVLMAFLGLLLFLAICFGPRLGKKAAPDAADQVLERHDAAEHAVVERSEPKPPADKVQAAPEMAAEPLLPDDLKVIEGIGPKIATVLQGAGITSFAALTTTPVDRLREILASQPRLRLADPTTWPEQARLAAAGDRDALAALQETLKGGRRV